MPVTPEHWSRYLKDLADRIYKPTPLLKEGDPRALRDCAEAMDKFWREAPAPKLAGPSSDPIGLARHMGDLTSRIEALEAKLQEGIDGGHRAKDELDAAIDAVAVQSRIRMQGHENRLEALEARSTLPRQDAENRIEHLETKAGALGEWAGAVDAQLNELFGKLLELEGDPPREHVVDTDAVPIKPIRLRLLGADGKLLLEYAISPWSEKFQASLPYEGPIQAVEVYRG